METLEKHMDGLRSSDKMLHDQAFTYLKAATEPPVEWAYEVWDELVALLQHGDNRQRAIASQALCNLAKSDPEKRMLRDFETLLTVTKDERFVTARHCLQAIWKVGLAGAAQQQLVVEGLERRFRDCSTEKNGTLIRYDILQGLRHLYDATKDETIRAKALELIELEADPKYRKKYATLWRERVRA
jgi:hypothetical protein